MLYNAILTLDLFLIWCGANTLSFLIAFELSPAMRERVRAAPQTYESPLGFMICVANLFLLAAVMRLIGNRFCRR